MSATIKYKGNTIATLNTDEAKTLLTSGRYCEADIVVENAQDGGIRPSGSLFITKNGEYDVTNYASANVNISIPDIKRWDITIANNIAEISTTILAGDSFIAENYSNENLALILHAKDWSGTDNRVLFIHSRNMPFMSGQERAGATYRRYNNSDGVMWPRMLTMPDKLNSLWITSSGDVLAKASSNANIVAGDYVLIGFLL